MDEETEKHIEKLEKQINDLYYHAQQLSEKLKEKRNYNVAEDMAMNIKIRGDDYIYMGGDDKPRKAGCDMWKFETWLSKCPVTIYKREDCANGWIEMHFIIDDERDED